MDLSEEYDKQNNKLRERLESVLNTTNIDTVYRVQLSLFSQWEKDNEEEEIIEFFSWAIALKDSEIKSISVLQELSRD